MKTLKDALPGLVPTIIRHQQRIQIVPPPTKADFAITYLPAPGKQQAGGKQAAKSDRGFQPNQSNPLMPPCPTVKLKNPDHPKVKGPEKLSTVVPQSEECALSNPRKVSLKRKAVSEESSSKKAPNKTVSPSKCKFCNQFETYYPYSLARHVRLKHPKVFNCKDCMQNFETGILCEMHILRAKSSIRALVRLEKSKIKALKRSKQEALAKSRVEALLKSRTDAYEKSKTEALKKQLECPGCKSTIQGALQLKAHAYTCIELSLEQKYKIRKSSVIGLANVRPTIKCKLCNRLFYKHSSLTKHKKSKHPGEIVKVSCEKCSFVSSSLKNLQAHILKTHEKVDQPEVKIKTKISQPDQKSAKKLFEDHPRKIVEKAKEKQFECQNCYSSFAKLDYLELHCLQMHPTTFRFVCRLCPEKKRFMFQASLDKHIESAHAQSAFRNLGEETSSSPDAEPLVSNDRNDHSYASPNNKKFEELMCSEETVDCDWGKMTKCELCDKMFVDEATKQLHFRAFHERKNDPLPCIICNQMFSSRMVLKIHVSSCRGPKKPKARLSGDGDTSTTKSPEKDQKGVPPKMIFTCSICKVPFDDLTELNLHLLNVHSLSSDKSETTSTKASEVASGSVKRKIKLVMYRCTQCTEVFVSKDVVLEHLQMKHGATDVVMKSY